MPKYRVPVRMVVVTTYEVEAVSKEAAMRKALDEDLPDCREISDSPGDPEVYYPEIEAIP